MKDTLVDLMRQGVHPNDLRDHPRVLELDAASRAIGLSPGSRRAFVGDSVKDTMVHELGHVLHERMLGGGTDREMFGALGGSKDAVDKSGIFPLA
ncbi:MAG: hypothetical protein GWN86_05345, partial [Desulfobacterales bacterium]|nr:hypothetical protein [Desulfobacterales bacterium]